MISQIIREENTYSLQVRIVFKNQFYLSNYTVFTKLHSLDNIEKKNKTYIIKNFYMSDLLKLATDII